MIEFSSVAKVPKSEPFAPVIPIRLGTELNPLPRRIPTARATALGQLITRCGVRRRLGRGYILFSKGDRARFWYFLEVGTLVLDPPEETALASSSTTLHRGEFFSMSAGDERIATCRALDDATVICIDRREVEALAGRNASFGEFTRKAGARELDWLAAQTAIASSGRSQTEHYRIDDREAERVDGTRMRRAVLARTRLLRAQELIAEMVGPLPPRR